MARNEEKQYGRLNRLHLQQQREEQLKKKPPRPNLHTLNSVADVKKWLPSITRDIDFNLKQSEVSCYPESKIREFQEQVRRLQGEYWAFVRKIKQLDPLCDVVPWTERGYSSRKRPAYTASGVPGTKLSRPDDSSQHTGSSHKDAAMTAAERLILPLVDNQEQHLSTQHHVLWDQTQDTAPQFTGQSPTCMQDKPLQFTGQTPTCMQDKPLQFTGQTPTCMQDKPLQLIHPPKVACDTREVFSAAMSSVSRQDSRYESDEDMEVVGPPASQGECTLLYDSMANPLGIDYESSCSSSPS